MFGVFPLTPAYGRDYKSKAEAEKDFLDGKDFATAGGPYASVRDFKGQQVTIRFDKLRKVHIFTVPA